MSQARSIDVTDLGGATVTLVTTTETLVLVGPMLQTPTPTSFVVILATVTLNTASSTTGFTLRIRQGSSVTGALVGQAYGQTTTAGVSQDATPIMVSQQMSNTDYVQHCLTVQQIGASTNGTVNGATLLAVSF